MALGIDIYRYQKVTDWTAVKRHGVSFVYVKGTDGGGVAQVRATAQVRGAQAAGIPVGLYHYAQLSPSPEVQADVLTGEVHRLDATGLPPALDLEKPHQPGAVARDFADRFVNRLRRNGFRRVTLYANTSMLTGIGAHLIDDPDLVIWAASFGPNDGRLHPLNYSGDVDIHQYTSVGTVPGISGLVDLNESLTDKLFSRGVRDVELTDKIRFDDGREVTVSKTMAESWQNSYDILAGVRTLLAAAGNNQTTVTLTEAQMDQLLEKVAGLHEDLTVDQVRATVADVLLHGAAAREGGE